MTQRPRSWSFAEFHLDEGERRLLRGGTPVPLTPKGFDLLVVLAERTGELVRKHELMERLWPRTFVGEGTLARHVSSVRKALGSGPSRQPLIQTVHKSGYRLLGPREAPAGAAEGGAARTLRALAVLPFRSLAAGSRDEALELGLADTLIARLSALPGLCVRSLASVRGLTDAFLDPAEAGRRLQVDAVLEGTLHRDGDRLRLNARLLEVAAGRAVWSHTFEEPAVRLFAMQDAVAAQVASALIPTLSPEAGGRGRRESRDAAAYALYLRGRHFWGQRTEQDLKKALACFEEGARRDPDCAAAHAGRADCLTLLAGYGVHPGALAEARQAAERALALDPECAEAHLALALIAQKGDGDWELAEARYRSALLIQPSHPTALQRRGELLVLLGRFDEGLAFLEQATHLEPASPIIGTDLAKALFLARRYPAAIHECRKVIEMDATFPRAHLYLGLAQLMGGDHEAALPTLAAFGRSDSSAYAHGVVAYASAVAGRPQAAREALWALRHLRRSEYVTPFAFALAHIGLGEHEAALDCLERLAGDGHGLIGLNVSPLMDPLRPERRFQALLRRAGLAAGPPAPGEERPRIDRTA